jgi:hypothetical protein
MRIREHSPGEPAGRHRHPDGSQRPTEGANAIRQRQCLDGEAKSPAQNSNE